MEGTWCNYVFVKFLGLNTWTTLWVLGGVIRVASDVHVLSCCIFILKEERFRSPRILKITGFYNVLYLFAHLHDGNLVWVTKDVLDAFVPRKSLVVEWFFMIPKSWRVRVYIFVISGWQKTHEPKNPTTPKMCFFYNAANSFATTNHPGNSCLMSEKTQPRGFLPGLPPKKKIIRKRRWKGEIVKAFFINNVFPIEYMSVYTYVQIYVY